MALRAPAPCSACLLITAGVDDTHRRHIVRLWRSQKRERPYIRVAACTILLLSETFGRALTVRVDRRSAAFTAPTAGRRLSAGRPPKNAEKRPSGVRRLSRGGHTPKTSAHRLEMLPYVERCRSVLLLFGRQKRNYESRPMLTVRRKSTASRPQQAQARRR